MKRIRGGRILTGFIASGLLNAAPLGCGAKSEEQVSQAPEVQVMEEQMDPVVQDGTTVRIGYTLTVDGAVVDSSEGRDPLSYVHGQGQIIPGLEKQLTGLRVSDVRDITVPPEEGYGLVDPQALIEISREQLSPELTLEVGAFLSGTDQSDRPFRARIHEVKDESVVLDTNHPLAGKTLQFSITVLDVSPAT